jgi:hypothetical protein
MVDKLPSRGSEVRAEAYSRGLGGDMVVSADAHKHMGRGDKGADTYSCCANALYPALPCLLPVSLSRRASSATCPAEITCALQKSTVWM